MSLSLLKDSIYIMVTGNSWMCDRFVGMCNTDWFQSQRAHKLEMKAYICGYI